MLVQQIMRWLAMFLVTAALAQDAKPRRIEVVADARILLISTAIWLATDGGFYGKPVDDNYANAVRTHFKDHREHPAVKRAGTLLRRGFSFDAPIGWILHFTNPPELKRRADVPDEIARRAPAKELEELAGELRDFYRDADFPAFLKSQQEFHAGLIARVKEVLDAEGSVKRLEAYFGEKKDSYTLTVAPLVAGHNYGPRVGGDVFQIFNPTCHPDKPALARGVLDMVYHEFGHSFANPAVDAHAERVATSTALFEPLREMMKRQAYGNWSTCVREHVVRACAYRLLREEAGDLKGARAVAEDYAKGFRYLPPLYRALEEYEKNRKKYRKLADFAPRLLDAIDKIAKEGSEAYLAREPFGGRINEVWSRPEPIVMVVPPEGKVADYARGVAEKFKTKPRVVTDAEALEMKAGESIFVAYGTVESNKFLAKLAAKLPLSVGKGAIIVDGEKFTGEKLRLIAAIPNPEKPALPLVIYTATSDDLIVGINSVFHGPTGFVVADGERKITSQGFLLRPR